jgi:hypothetical protein
VVAVEPSMSTDTVVVPETENVPEVKERVASLTQNGKPAPLLDVEPLLEDEVELEELLDDDVLPVPDDELELEELPQHVNCAHAVSRAPPAARAIVK